MSKDSKDRGIARRKSGTGRKAGSDALWATCDHCNGIVSQTALESNCFVCPHCNYHYRLSPWGWIDAITTGFSEWDKGLVSGDPLGFDIGGKSYRASLERSQAKTGLEEAVVTGLAELNGRSVALAVMSFDFIGGSMASVVGEKIARAVERSIESRVPLVTISASGGARMQEGIFSLMQMAKTSAAVGRLHEAKIPFVSVLTHPTTGGVAASFAFLADIVLAEPGALIGFAGPRVIEETIKEKLPKGFQTAEFLVEHGFVDRVVERSDLKEMITKLVQFFGTGRPARRKQGSKKGNRVQDPV
ncbi:MAG: acetyl-CoA carboxylase, carboxyltransferase subunit beta [Terriglobia bacterium]